MTRSAGLLPVLFLSLAPVHALAQSDTCAGSSFLIVGQQTAFDLAGATTEVGSSCRASVKDRYFRFKCPADGMYTIEWSGTALNDLVVSVHAPCPGDPAPGPCSQAGETSFTFFGVPDTTYHIRLAVADTATGAEPAGTIRITGQGAACETPAIALLGTNRFDNTSCPPVNAPACFESDFPLYFSFSADADGGIYGFETCTGLIGNTLLTILAECGDTWLACNDDSCGQGSRVDGVPISPSGTVIVRIAGMTDGVTLGTVVSGSLSVFESASAPLGDSCGSPMLVGLGDTWYDTSTATADGSTTSCDASTNEVYVQFQAPDAGGYIFRVTAANGAARPTLTRTGSCLDNGTCEGTVLTFTASAGGQQQVLRIGNTNGRAAGVLEAAPITLNDFGVDGLPDVVLRSRANGLSTSRGTDGAPSDGTLFTGETLSLPSVTSPVWIISAKGDLNNDGLTDILWRNITNGANVAWLMRADEIVQAVSLPQVSDTDWRMVGVGQFNSANDSQPDILWHNMRTGQLVVWLMSSPSAIGSQATLTTVTNTAWIACHVADMDRDGHADIVWRNYRTGDNLVWYFTNTAVRENRSITNVFAAWRLADVADLDGDGGPDLLWRNWITGAMVVWKMNSNAVVAAYPVAAAPAAAQVVAGEKDVQVIAKDFDQNGTEDIVWQNTRTAGIVVWTMNSTGGVLGGPTVTTAPAGFEAVVVADLNGDNSQDLLLRNQATGANRLLPLLGLTAQPTIDLPANDAAWVAVAAGDVNNDGVNDIYWRNTTTGANAVWRMQLSSNLTPSILDTLELPGVADQAWKIAGVGDFNGDRRPDIVWRNSVTGSNVVWVMSGATILNTLSLPAVADTGWEILKVGDMNRDGRPDLVWRHRTNGSNAIWFMNGSTVLANVALPQVADTGWTIRD